MTHGHLPSRKHTFQVLTLETVLLDFLRRGISLYYIFFFHNKVCPGFSVSVFVLNLSKKITLKEKHELHGESSVWYKCCFLKGRKGSKLNCDSEQCEHIWLSLAPLFPISISFKPSKSKQNMMLIMMVMMVIMMLVMMTIMLIMMVMMMVVMVVMMLMILVMMVVMMLMMMVAVAVLV